MTSLKQKLAEHSFLKGLDSSQFQLVAECATEIQFDPGEQILQEGQEANQFYLICQGKIALGSFIPGRGFTTIQTLDDDEVVGWSWLIPPYQWRFNALTILPTQAIALDGHRLREKCEQDHDFGYELMKRLAVVIGQRLTATRMRLEV